MIVESHKPIMSFRNYVKNIDKVDNRVSWQVPITQLMRDHGFQAGGTGKYGSVFIHRDLPYIIKIFMKDTAYLTWLNYCFKRQNNPYVPKIRGKVVKLTNTFFAVRLERLTWNEQVADKFIREIEASAFDVPKDLYLQDIAFYINQHRKLYDIHHSNVMARGNQPVLIDPFYNWYKDGKFTIDPDDISNFDELF